MRIPRRAETVLDTTASPLWVQLNRSPALRGTIAPRPPFFQENRVLQLLGAPVLKPKTRPHETLGMGSLHPTFRLPGDSWALLGPLRDQPLTSCGTLQRL